MHSWLNCFILRSLESGKPMSCRLKWSQWGSLPSLARVCYKWWEKKANLSDRVFLFPRFDGNVPLAFWDIISEIILAHSWPNNILMKQYQNFHQCNIVIWYRLTSLHIWKLHYTLIIVASIQMTWHRVKPLRARHVYREWCGLWQKRVMCNHSQGHWLLLLC